MEAYAVIETGGKQYLVRKGNSFDVDSLGVKEGEVATFDRVLAVSDGSVLTVGTPTLKGASVSATVVKHLRGPKVVAFKKRRRKGFHKKIGHRQELTRIQIGGIAAG